MMQWAISTARSILGGRDTGKFPKLSGEMRLIGVAGRGGNVTEAGLVCCSQASHGRVEPLYPAEMFGAHTDGSAKQGNEMSRAKTRSMLSLRDTGQPLAGTPRQRLRNGGVHEQGAVKRGAKGVFWANCRHQALAKSCPSLAPYSIERHVAIDEFRHRGAEQGSGGARTE
jgi:hypothetical protein